MKETLYLVTDIFFDITRGGDDETGWSDSEYQSLNNDAIGLWYARDINHLCDKISEKFGFGVIDIKATTNTLHPLTSYL